MFRDDHEAALARIEALEAELARGLADDAAQIEKLAKLEAQLNEAKAKLRKLETELEQHRPAPKRTPAPRVKPQRFVSATEPIEMTRPTSGRGGAIAVAVLLLAIVVVGLVLIVQSGSLNR